MSTECTVRMYGPHDIPRVIEIAMGALPRLPNYGMLTPDKDRIEYVLRHNIDNAAAFAGWVLCDSHDVPQGIVGGWCVRNLMSLDYVADDIFLWIEPKYRTFRNANQLIQVYLDWAKAKDAKLIRASHSGGSFPRGTREWEMFDALLRRAGFKEVGSIYHYGEK
jgi:GNAT superfamily N-acetyltransferase